ncbi:sporulation integral membrane protein YtvI [Priestia megaterium]|nr:sporulation integral membrane protein YtvI [Priestia megaterium]
MYTLYIHRTIRLLIVLFILIIGVLLSYYIATLTYPFLIALFIAFLMNPLVNFLEDKLKLKRYLAVLVSIILLFSILAGLITLLITEIIAGTEYLSKVVPNSFEAVVVYVENFIASNIIPLYNQISSMFNTLNTGQQETIMSNIQSVGSSITKTVGTFVQNLLQSIPLFLSWLPNAATVIIFSLLATFFISKDWYRLINIGNSFLPEKAKQWGDTIVKDLKSALFGFIQAQLTLISITTVIVLIGLLILRVDYAITVALLIGLVDILPYLGTGLVFVPWIIYAFATGNSSFAIGLSVLYVVVLVQRQLMEPKILSSSIGLDPLATLVALFVGFKLIGFLGLIAGPVLLVILKTLHTTGVFRDVWQFIIGK